MRATSAAGAGALAAALWLASGPARAQEGAPPPSAPEGPPARDGGRPLEIRPHLTIGMLADDRSGLGLAGDLGVRVERVLVRASYRVVGYDSGAYVTFASGRAGWIFAENGWLAGLCGVGLGTLGYSYATAGSASVTALSLEAAALLLPHDWFGPPLSLGIEVPVALGRASHPPGETLSPPAVIFSLGVGLAVVGGSLSIR